VESEVEGYDGGVLLTWKLVKAGINTNKVTQTICAM